MVKVQSIKNTSVDYLELPEHIREALERIAELENKTPSDVIADLVMRRIDTELSGSDKVQGDEY